uniref:KIF-binding protein n=1 Tax=Sciurus vulgaris TaxID=55149 RepID=A0A8D2DX72_SCIVU
NIFVFSSQVCLPFTLKYILSNISFLKYSARALLEEVEDERPQAHDGLGGGDHALRLPTEVVEAEGPVAQRAVRLVVMEFHLGVNHIDTEDLSAGEEHLVKCLRQLRRYRLSHDCISLYIQAQNNLGILWSEREEIETARAYLESSEALYNQYMNEIGSPPLDPTEHFLPEEEKLTEQERSKRFEKVYTHNLYYLAQVYQHMEMFEKAAHYCHSTDYHPMEWAINAAINAATLSQFYINKLCFMEARHCLSAANVIFGQTGKIQTTEDTPETEGDKIWQHHWNITNLLSITVKSTLRLPRK